MTPPARESIGVLLIDDHQLVRTGLRILIERHPRMVVVGEAANRTQALDVAAREQPDIILLDLDMGGASSLDFLPQLQLVAPSARAILVTGVRAPEEYHHAVQLGVMGLVRKEEASEVLLEAIEKVHAGEAWLEPSLVARMINEMARARGGAVQPADPEAAKIASLTRREREVVALVGEGLYNNQIAARLSISESTVNHHLTSILKKLGLTNRFDLVVYAYRHDLAKSR
jgi:two-component system, NarL family, nitrate/nitrite response regulator NarL